MGGEVGERKHVPFFLDLVGIGKWRGAALRCWRGEENGKMLLGKKWDEAKIPKAGLAFQETVTYAARPESVKSV